MIRLRPSGADEVLIKRVSDWYDPGPGASITAQSTFSPLSLFSSGAQGVWYDPSDFSTMFQDSAGTTPVTAVGQPVGKILDKSGRGNHATQATAGNRPVLQQDSSGRYYLSFNGTSFSMATGSIDFTATDKMFVSAGVRKLTDAAAAIVVELSSSQAANNGSFYLAAPLSTATKSFAFLARGTINTFSPAISPSNPAPVTAVVTGLGIIGGTTPNELRINRVSAASVATSIGTGNYGNYPLYVGARGGTSLFFNGQLYQLIIVGKPASVIEISNTEFYINQKTGAY